MNILYLNDSPLIRRRNRLCFSRFTLEDRLFIYSSNLLESMLS